MIKDYLNFVEGLYSDTPEHLIPDNALALQSNVVSSYKLGALLKRPGYTIVGAALQANKSITGLHNFRQSASVQKMLATVDDSTSDDTQLFYSTGGAWTEITAAETAWANKASINVEMEDFIGYCFMVGWGSTDGFITSSSLTGTTFSTSTNVTSMPSAKYIRRYRDRLYIANCDISGTAYPYRVYYSSVPSSGTITWTVASNFLDVDYSEAITGLEQNWDRLVIFTEYSAYMYNQSEFKKTWDVGCSNHHTLRNSGAYMIWANRDGVWASTGGRPQNVGGRVIDFIRATDMTGTFAEVVDEEYYLYLGTPTVNGITYANCALVWNIPTQTWRVEEYGHTPTIFAKYYSSGQDALWIGDTVGKIYKKGKYTDSTLLTSDNGTPINSWFQTKSFYFDTPATWKHINKVYAYGERAQGLQLKARVLDRNLQALTPFKPLGQLTKYINEFSVNPDKGNFIQFEGVENGSLQYWSFYGVSCEVELDKPTKN